MQELLTEGERQGAAGAPGTVTFLSAADQTYSRTLLQLLLSAQRHDYVEGYRWIAYDLGMEPATRAKLEARFPWCEFRTLDLAALPPHFLPKRGSYAWKPFIVWEVAEHAPGLLCWMDSANIIKGSLAPMLDRTSEAGLFVLNGQTAMLERCDPLVMRKAGMPGRYRGTREVVSGLLCFDPHHPAVREILRLWRELAFDEDAIRPAKLDVPGHTNDQALLSCLLYAAQEKGEIGLDPPDVDISAPYPIQFVSTRNKMPHWTPAAADPLVRARYATEKFLDQRYHRLDRWLGGKDIFRWRKERFAVFLRKKGTAEKRALPAPWRRYYADPFLWEEDGRLFVFFEDFSYYAQRAMIAAVELDGGLRPVGKPKTVLDPGCHASFPFLFRHDGQLFMVPETWEAGGIDLYRCERFPDRWRRVRRILDGVDAADSVIFPHADRWWLITSLNAPNPGPSGRFLAIFSTEDPLRGRWEPHPVNRETLFIDGEAGTGRNAGSIIAWEGRLFRPMQKSSRFYGEGTQMMEIVELTPERFHEQPAVPPYPLEDLAGKIPGHHISTAGGAVAWDERTVDPMPVGPWRRLRKWFG